MRRVGESNKNWERASNFFSSSFSRFWCAASRGVQRAGQRARPPAAGKKILVISSQVGVRPPPAPISGEQGRRRPAGNPHRISIGLGIALLSYVAMKDSQDTQSPTELQSSAQGTNEVQSNQMNPMATDAPAGDSGSLSVASTDNRKVSREDIELVQNLIERCLQLYMNKGEVVRTLSTRARIEPGFTTLVWQKLEEENSEFFRAYYIRLKLKRQIILFNHLLQHQYNLMKYPAPHMPVNNLPMGYPVLQQPMMPAPGQPHIEPMACGLSGEHVANGIPAAGGYHPIRMNSGNDMVVDNGAPETAHAGATCSAMSSEMAVSPSSAASSNHAPFTPSEIPGMNIDTSALDSAFGSDVGITGQLQLGPDGSSRDSIRSLGQLWNFSLSDLTADLTSLGDLEALENYAGTPFLASDSDILLDSPDQNDIVEYFADAINGPSQSDEEK